MRARNRARLLQVLAGKGIKKFAVTGVLGPEVLHEFCESYREAGDSIVSFDGGRRPRFLLPWARLVFVGRTDCVAGVVAGPGEFRAFSDSFVDSGAAGAYTGAKCIVRSTLSSLGVYPF